MAAISSHHSSPSAFYQPLSPHKKEFVHVALEVGKKLGFAISWNFIPKEDEKENPDMNALLYLSFKEMHEPIDIFALKHDGKWKAKNALTDELRAKITEHLNAKKDPCILISSSGSKFNTAFLPETVKVEIDPEGWLRINGKQLLYETKPIPAYALRSYTIHQLRVEEDLLIIEDEYEKIRPGGEKPFVINLSEKKEAFTCCRSREEAKKL